MSFFDKIGEWRNDETVRGIAPWVLSILALIIFLQNFTYLRTSLDETVEGLESRTMYVQNKRSGFCVGDMVHFRSSARSSKYFRTVAAESGAVFSLDAAGYQIDGVTVPMPVEWRAKAELEMNEQESLTVPEGHILFVNPEFEAEKAYNFWAFDTVPRSRVTDRISHILFSRDLSRIGEPVGTASPNCVR